MAHELDMANGRANMAFTGSRSQIWHGLGVELEQDAPIDTWIVEAGLNWQVESTDVLMHTPTGIATIPGKQALFRSDTEASLSIVGKDFKVVQPREVIEFFRDLVEKHDMRLSTAGSLFEGRRFWALAELGKDFEVVDGDKVTGNLLLTTAVDGSLHTTARFVSTRVVCNNTLNVALGEKMKNLVKVSHRAKWDPDRAKMDLGLIDEAWYKFITDMRTLAATPVSDSHAREFFTELLFEDVNKKGQEIDKTAAFDRKVENLMNLYDHGAGADLTRGTYWGMVNAVTEAYTHGSGRRNESHQFWDGFYGHGADLKDKACAKALAEAA